MTELKSRKTRKQPTKHKISGMNSLNEILVKTLVLITTTALATS